MASDLLQYNRQIGVDRFDNKNLDKALFGFVTCDFFSDILNSWQSMLKLVKIAQLRKNDAKCFYDRQRICPQNNEVNSHYEAYLHKY